MLKIGEFARLSRVPVKTLRYYDEIGLLKPSGVDRWTRYRYYTAEQSPALERILTLKQLGFSLDEVAYLASDDVSPADLAARLHARCIALRQEISAAQERLAQAEAWLEQTEQTSEMKEHKMKPDKIVKMDRFFTVGLAYLGKNDHGEISKMWEVFNGRVAEVKHIIRELQVVYGICSPNPQGLVDYVASVPVSSMEDMPEGMVSRDVPAQTYAVFTAHGLGDIMGAYDRCCKQWLPLSEYTPGDGPDFELYPPDWENESSPVYIYFPIKKK